MQHHQKYRLSRIPPDKVAFSATNPRGESAEDIAKDETFERLKDSVYRFGVLVPIVVHEQEGNPAKPYRLVDGERRLRAALETGVKRIPAHIAAQDDPLDDLVQAVHIHMLRKQWSPVAQARAIRRVMVEHHRKTPLMAEEDPLAELQDLTGCTDTKLKSLRRAARYTEPVLEAVEEGEIVFSHLVQFEESFVEQLEKHYPALLRSLGKRNVRESLVQKARQKILTNTRALMNNVVPVVSRATSVKEKKLAAQLLEEFVTHEEMPAEEVLKRFEREFPTAQEDLLRHCEDVIDATDRLVVLLKGLKPDQLASFPQMARRLGRCLGDLRTEISVKLRIVNPMIK